MGSGHGGKDGDVEQRDTVFVGLGLTSLEIENRFSRTSGGKLHRCGVNGQAHSGSLIESDHRSLLTKPSFLAQIAQISLRNFWRLDFEGVFDHQTRPLPERFASVGARGLAWTSGEMSQWCRNLSIHLSRSEVASIDLQSKFDLVV